MSARETPSQTPVLLPDGNRDLIRSGVWPARTLVPDDAFPEALVLVAADRRLAPRLRAPLPLRRERMGAHVVELLLERGEDGSVCLSLRIPSAPTQFKDPYILMEAEGGNTREVGVREVQFHLQGRLGDVEIAAADWAAFFGAAARKLEALRGTAARRRSGSTPGRAPARAPARKARAPKRKASPKAAGRRTSSGRRPPRRGGRR
jgi:hypothetical protein